MRQNNKENTVALLKATWESEKVNFAENRLALLNFRACVEYKMKDKRITPDNYGVLCEISNDAFMLAYITDDNCPDRWDTDFIEKTKNRILYGDRDKLKSVYDED